jgi:ribonuclease Y
MELWLAVVIAAACFVVSGVLFGLVFHRVGYQARRKKAEAEIGSAEEEAKRIREEGKKNAETAKKEALISAKEEILRQRNEAEKELKERRADVSRMERRVAQKEETLDKKAEAIEHKNEQLDKKLKENDALREQIEELRVQEMKILENISGISATEAKASSQAASLANRSSVAQVCSTGISSRFQIFFISLIFVCLRIFIIYCFSYLAQSASS